jgi:colanic acid biosynthesis glycosyl transferase WcaI
MYKVLYVEQFIYPDGWPGCEIPISILNRLVETGKRVTALTGSRPYLQFAQQHADLNPYVNLARCPTPLGHKYMLSKLINSATFSFGLLCNIFLFAKADVVLCQTNPPQVVILVAILCNLLKRKYIIICMDLYPEVFTRRHSLPSILEYILNDSYNKSYSKATRVVSIGSDMTRVLKQKGVDPNKISLIPNWSLGGKEINKHPSNIFYQKLGVSHENLILLYSGNLGTAHDWKTIYEIAESMKLIPSIKIIVVSSGKNYNRLKQIALKNSLSNLIFSQSVETQELPSLLGIASMGIVSIKKDYGGVVVPSKFASLLSRGIPVLYIGPQSNISEMIEEHKLGFWVKNRDVQSLVKIISSINAGKIRLEGYSHRCKEAYAKFLSKEKALEGYIKMIDSLFDGVV